VVLESFPERPDEQPHGKGELEAGRCVGILLDAGLEKTRVFKKRPSPVVFFFKYICPEEFLGFFQFQEYF
jgi:hypothetical protein